MKWDGTAWTDIGFGTTANFGSINKLLVHHNKLWVFGGFDQCAGSFASNVAIYDGVNWCGLKDTLDNVIGSAAVYHDTIYVAGGFWKSNSDSLKFIAKLKDPTLFHNCINVGLKEQLIADNIKLFSNPASSTLNIVDEQNELQGAFIEITNSIGQTVLQLPFTSSIDIGELAKGCYFITITTK